MQTLKVNTVICNSCVKYRKKQTDYLEVLYHCSKEGMVVIMRAMGRVRKSTPRVDEAMLKNKCDDFELRD